MVLTRLMVMTYCPICDGSKSRNAQHCQNCANEARARALKGVPHPEERKRKNSETSKRQHAEGRAFDIGGSTRGKPARNAVPVGTERVVKDGRVQTKCEDGRWRYRSRLVWEWANGPISAGIIIHHRDEDPMNDHIANLEPLTRAQHARHHATPEAMRQRQLASAASKRARRT